MDTSLLVGLILVFVVGFFAWQWYSSAGRRRAAASGRASIPAPAPPTSITQEGPAVETPVKEERMPVVAGQTEQDLLAKEAPQERRTGGQQQPATASGLGPAAVEDNLRHPEALFHQPSEAPPTMRSDVAAGRASEISTPGVAGGVQGFSPEMAQNGGAVVGSSVFAFDGMEPTGFASF